MRRFPVPCLSLWLLLSLLITPSLQASIWSAPGALNIHNAPTAATATSPSRSHSIFRTLRDRLIESIWSRPGDTASRKPKHTKYDSQAAAATAPDQLLKKYGSDIVLRFELNTDDERKALQEAADTLFLDVWQLTRHWADIRLSKDIVNPLFGLLPTSIKSKPLIFNLAQAVFESQRSAADEAASCPPATPNILTAESSAAPVPRSNPVFENYQPLSVIVPWMKLLQSMFSTHVRIFDIGTSFEGRGIPAIRVGSHPHNAERYERRRKTVVLVGGQHAREWVSTAAVNYAAYELITAYGKDRQLTKLVEEYDFVFIPTLNPDGYVYTWESDRLWRKTRQQTHLSFCPGLDLDRTFAFEWDGENTKGNPCSESYAGESVFAATEARAFADWMRNETDNNNAQIVGFLDFHSYSQQILYPYAYTCDTSPGAYEDLQELAIGLKKAMHTTNGKLYTVASACEGKSLGILEAGTGGSALDWMFNQSVKFSYQIKLPDTGSYGFLLPAREIVPTGKEVFNVLVYFSQFLLETSSVQAHDESPSTGDHPFMSSKKPAREAEADETNIDDIISQELEEQPDEPILELRRRR